jgi:hypothetical protein
VEGCGTRQAGLSVNWPKRNGQVAISEINQWGRWQPASQQAPSTKQASRGARARFLACGEVTRLDTFPTFFEFSVIVQAKVGSQVARSNLVARKGNILMIIQVCTSKVDTGHATQLLINNEAYRQTHSSPTAQQIRFTAGRYTDSYLRSSSKKLAATALATAGLRFRGTYVTSMHSHSITRRGKSFKFLCCVLGCGRVAL